MHHLARVTFLVLAAALSVAGFQEARQSITAAEIRAHLYFLSHDNLQGRAPGTRGGQLAGDFIASQFLRMGLEPVNGSYFQHVPLTGVTTDPTTLLLAFEGETERLAAHYPGDAVIWPGVPQPGIQVSGELVFVGYGAQAPQWRWDDIKGRDLNGKIVVFLAADPPASPDEPTLFDGRAMTYHGQWTYKLEKARRLGATGALIIHSERAGFGWNVVQSSWTGEQLGLARDDADGPPLLLQGWLTQDFARRLFAMVDLDLDELYVRATRRDFRPLATGITVRARMNSRSRQLETRNVVGMMPGGDPEVGEEVVVVTSHYDHLGSDSGLQGDSIYNGARDNASGVSVLLEVADAFARLEPRPDRSVLFIATAANQAGLLGSQHYVAHPLIPLERTVAALNLDGANVWGETDDVVVHGAGRSSLGSLVAPRAEELGMTLVSDPAPETGSFYRSDHFPFARAGIPALDFDQGLSFRGRAAGWGEDLMAGYLARHHLQPSDEYDPEFDLSGAVQQGRLMFGVAFDIANWDTVAAWNPGDEFATDGRGMTR